MFGAEGVAAMSEIDTALVLLAVANAIAFLGFLLDKRRAQDGGWRVAERTRLSLALIGGLGAWMGQHILRHKTRKEPFRTLMGVALAMHAVGVVAGFWWLLR